MCSTLEWVSTAWISPLASNVAVCICYIYIHVYNIYIYVYMYIYIFKCTYIQENGRKMAGMWTLFREMICVTRGRSSHGSGGLVPTPVQISGCSLGGALSWWCDEQRLVEVVLRLSVVPRERAIGLLATQGPDCSGQGEGWSFLAPSRASRAVAATLSFQACLRTCICACRMCLCIYVYVCKCSDMYICIYMHVYTYMYTCACIYMCICMCMHICA